MSNVRKIIAVFARVLICVVLFGATFQNTYAVTIPDTDGDRLLDSLESIYGTDPLKNDTDNDGYSDGDEINLGYSALHGRGVLMRDIDTDDDWLNDWLEAQFSSNVLDDDTDNDGFTDGDEVSHGYDPTHSEPILLEKKIHVVLTKQRLDYYLGSVKLGSMVISSGKSSMPTPKGEFVVVNKSLKAWSKRAGLWMPYWMGFSNGRYGIHELPIWPNGVREGEQHLGKPVSHGCIRLGKDAARILYEWTPIGTKLIISES